ncbi:MAG: hypothetical protein H0X64_00705 [Gemmatimonadaceae bacterium]|nr:hypothetical protein [Gemmatimonadaceae bacterium]
MQHFILRAPGIAALALVALATTVEAQAGSAAAHRRLQQSLDAQTYRAVAAVFEKARERGVPVEPLVNRALQATLHRTPGPQISAAISTLADRLGVAKAALGPGSSDAEISAGADALARGVPRETLVQIRTLSPGRPVTVPLGVLTELVARDVTVGRASQMVVALLRNGATPAQLVSLSDDVKHDIDAGIAAGAALDIRTRGALGTLEQGLGDGRAVLPATPGPGERGGNEPRKAPRKP